MNEDYFKNYLEEIKSKYDIEKNGDNFNYLSNCTRAKLRKLCVEKFRKDQNINDLKIFNFFMHFEFNIHNLNRITDNTDKFRPIETFFKGKTILSEDVNGTADMAAFLVDFNPRPFAKYREEKVAEKSKTSKTPPTPPPTSNESAGPKTTNPSLIKKITVGTTLFIVIFLGVNFFMKDKKSIEWINEYYEKTDNSPHSLIDGKLLTNIKKIIPCDTTSYKKDGKICLWYGKSLKGKIEFFTALGFHPETGKSLKEVTPYIMDKYGKGSCE